ncbi:unnamed protein product [Anisakis simplex]|uniref:Calponin-homology (CH) domain-containing protein n=1 Tax=Anisakis simplex TaxID=6269 RepID=A0A0M3K6B5_ANISI|nr:unnamed protein product [Anisakis simplex]
MGGVSAFSMVQQQKVSPNRCTDLGRSKARSSKLKRPTLSAATSTPAAPGSTTLHTTSSTSKSGASGKATNAVRMGGVMSNSSRTKSAVRKQLRETGASMARRLSSSARRSSPSQSLATSSTAQSLNGRDRDRNGNHRRRDDTQTQSEVVVLREDNHSTNNNATTAATKTTLKNNSECNEPAEKRTHLVSVDDSSLEASHLDACEEKEADDRERSELREKYISAKRGSSVLSAQVSSYAERVDSLKNELEQSRKRETQLHVQIDHLSNLLKQKAVDEYERNELQTKDENKENSVLRNLVQENERLRLRINGLLSEKEALRVSLQKANEEIDRLKEELLKLNSTIEVEREEWDRMQSDLLIAVRVANDFKLEAQEEMKTLYAKIADLQKRRQSNLANMSSGSIKLFDERSTCWEDIAWERLMRGCERGSRRNALLRWCQQSISPSYPNIELTNFSSCWTDGKALCYLLANFYPEKIDAKVLCCAHHLSGIILAFSPFQLQIFINLALNYTLIKSDFVINFKKFAS